MSLLILCVVFLACGGTSGGGTEQNTPTLSGGTCEDKLFGVFQFTPDFQCPVGTRPVGVDSDEVVLAMTFSSSNSDGGVSLFQSETADGVTCSDTQNACTYLLTCPRSILGDSVNSSFSVLRKSNGSLESNLGFGSDRCSCFGADGGTVKGTCNFIGRKK